MPVDLPHALDAPASVARDFDTSAESVHPLPFSVLRKRCDAAPESRADEIVVCAIDEDQFRLRRLPDQPAATPGSVALGDGTEVGGRVESAGIGPGVTSNRVMIDMKLKF